MIRGLSFKNKKAAAFGAYGWSGENVKLITEELKKAGMDIVDDGIRELWNPDEDGLNRCREFGKKFAESLQKSGTRAILQSYCPAFNLLYQIIVMKQHDKKLAEEVLEKLKYDKDESKTDYSEELAILKMVWEEKLLQKGMEFYKK